MEVAGQRYITNPVSSTAVAGKQRRRLPLRIRKDRQSNTVNRDSAVVLFFKNGTVMTSSLVFKKKLITTVYHKF